MNRCLAKVTVTYALAVWLGVVSSALAESKLAAEFVPPQGMGQAVLLLAGAAGPSVQDPYARDLARQGYYVSVVDSRKLFAAADSTAYATAAIQEAKSSPHASGTKVVVIGFSLGGAGALGIATALPDSVESVVLYYPASDWLFRNGYNLRSVVGGIKVPTLFLAAGSDRMGNCCTLDTARKIEAVAKELSAPLELVVYRNADHAFNVSAYANVYRASDDTDAFKRTLGHIQQHHME
jgi:pimeloyl-ACP methyl ester carboxylesterase